MTPTGLRVSGRSGGVMPGAEQSAAGTLNNSYMFPEVRGGVWGHQNNRTFDLGRKCTISLKVHYFLYKLTHFIDIGDVL